MMSRYSFKDFENCMCIKSSDLVQNISYFFSDSFTSYIDFEVKFNDNITGNQSKYNYYIDYFNNNTPRGYLYFVDSVPDIEKYMNPFRYFLNFHVELLNPSSQIITNLYLNTIDMTLDDSILITGNLILLHRS